MSSSKSTSTKSIPKLMTSLTQAGQDLEVHPARVGLVRGCQVVRHQVANPAPVNPALVNLDLANPAPVNPALVNLDLANLDLANLALDNPALANLALDNPVPVNLDMGNLQPGRRRNTCTPSWN